MHARRVLFILGLLAAGVPQAASAQSHICWIARIAKASDGSAEIKFTASAHGTGAVLSPNVTRPVLNFTVEGEVVRLRETVDSAVVEKESPVLLVPPGKEATMTAGRESCAFSWSEKDGHRGLFITATSTSPLGAATSSADEFIVLE